LVTPVAFFFVVGQAARVGWWLLLRLRARARTRAAAQQALTSR
jgi:hypothetical protein